MRAFWPMFYALGAALFTAFYFQPPINAPGASLESLTALRGATPYQYRVLLPLLARGIQAVTPLSIITVYAALTFVFVFVLLLAWREYLRPVFGDSAEVYALAMLYPLLWNYVVVSGFRYPWDVPAIAFFAVGLVLLRRDDWRFYYLAFFFACLNRETSCFLVLAFALLQWRLISTWRWLLHIAAQSAIWLAVKLILTRAFLHNPGEKVFENHLAGNLDFVARMLRHPLDSLDWTLLTFGWMLILITLGWRKVPADWKRLLLIAPPFLSGMMVVGDFGQIRIHNELVPILLAPALWSLEQARRRIFAPREMRD